MDYFADIATKFQGALDSIDNFEASNKLTIDQIEAWLIARDAILAAMGAAVALELTMGA